MLTNASLKNLTVFSHAELTFAKGINIVTGENGSGKSHFLKALYSAIAASAEEGRKPTASAPTKMHFQKVLAEKLVNVIRPEALGRLARRKQGRERCELSFEFDNAALNCSFNFATASKSEVQIETLSKEWHDKAPVFLPTRELLTLYPNFISVYETHYFEF